MNNSIRFVKICVFSVCNLWKCTRIKIKKISNVIKSQKDLIKFRFIGRVLCVLHACTCCTRYFPYYLYIGPFFPTLIFCSRKRKEIKRVHLCASHKLLILQVFTTFPALCALFVSFLATFSDLTPTFGKKEALHV